MTRRARAAAAALVLFSGCVLPTGTTRAGRPVHGVADKIVAGVTTRQELLRLVGPPMAVARRGEYVSVPAGSDPARGSYVQQADAWLESFAARRPLLDDHRVYYWYFMEDRGTRVFVPLFLVLVWNESRASSLEELWVLVDERTGVVVDLVRR